MNNITLHIHIGERRTTVTLHPILFQLASLKLSGQMSAKAEVGKWLSQTLTAQLGENHPKNQGATNGLTRYATDAIISIIADAQLYAQWQTIQYGGDE